MEEYPVPMLDPKIQQNTRITGRHMELPAFALSVYSIPRLRRCAAHKKVDSATRSEWSLDYDARQGERVYKETLRENHGCDTYKEFRSRLIVIIL